MKAEALAPRFGSSAALSLSLLALVNAVQCGGDPPAGGLPPGDNNHLDGDFDGTDGGSGGAAGGPGLNQDGGREELSEQQVQQILKAECTGWAGEGETVPATLELVIDTSGSMTQQPPGSDNGPSKWEITRDALEAAISELPAAVSLGAVYFPAQNVTSRAKGQDGPIQDCIETDSELPLAQLSQEHLGAFVQSLDAVSVESYTPTHDAYTYALEQHLIPYPAATKFILLITDGAPTIDLGCSWPTDPPVTGELYDGAGSADGATDPIVASVQAAYDTYGIRTFLIGAPGSEKSVESSTDKRPWLSQAAIAGGTATPGCSVEGPNYCHFDMALSTDFSGALTDALANIGSQVADACTFTVPDAPKSAGDIEIDETQVIIEWGDGTNSLIIPDSIGDCTDGWKYNTADQTVVLCKATCDELKLDPAATIHVSFGCTRDDIDKIVK